MRIKQLIMVLALLCGVGGMAKAQMEPCYLRDTVHEEYSICEGEPSVTWRNGVVMEMDSVYFVADTFAGVGVECDSITVYEAIFHVYPNPTPKISGRDSICQGETTTLTVEGNYSLRWRGPRYINGAITQSIMVNQSGTYIITASDENSCLGRDTMVVVVSPSPVQYDTMTRCADAPYDLHGTICDHTGDYSVVLPTVENCDSTINLHLIVNPLPVLELEGMALFCEGSELCITAHGGDHYEWSNGTDSNVMCITSGGTYSVRAWTSDGCYLDSVLPLGSYPSYEEHITGEICRGEIYTFYDVDYTRAGNYTHREVSMYGCDSLFTLHLGMKEYSTYDFTIHTSDSFLWNGLWYKYSGDFSQVSTGENGCDSISTLHLEIIYNNPVPKILLLNERILMVDHTVEYADGEKWHGYAGYQWYKNGRMMRGFTGDKYYEEDYGVLSGCFYVMVTADPSGSTWMSSDTICVNYVGVDGADDCKPKIWPNPARVGSTLYVSGCGVKSARLIDMQGRTIAESDSEGRIRLGNAVRLGLYAIETVNADGKRHIEVVPVK